MVLVVFIFHVYLTTLIICATKAQESIELWTRTIKTRKGSLRGNTVWLKTFALTSSTQDPTTETFVEFVPNNAKYVGIFSFDASSVKIAPNKVSNIVFNANALAQDISTQKWIFQIRNFRTKKWMGLSSNKNKVPSKWNFWKRTRAGPLSDFLNPNKFVKIRLASNNSNGNFLLDYLRLSLVVTPSAPSPSPVSIPTSVPSNRLKSIDELTYLGAFRLNSDTFGESNIDYAIGIMAYHPERNSIFIVGHDHENAIAEFPISKLGKARSVSELPVVNPTQSFKRFLNQLKTDGGINRITGMLIQNGQLLVNAENWYGGGANNLDTTLIIRDLTNLEGTSFDGFFRMNGGAQSSGYLGSVPEEWQDSFKGAKYYTGWSSVHSGASRYSHGPSLWMFDASGIFNYTSSPGDAIPATPYMNFPYSYAGNTLISEGALQWAQQGTPGPFEPADPLWNPLSEGVYGFFVPESSTFLVIGSTGGLKTGIGYKAVQEDGNTCGGPCPYGTDDNYNYYWMFDINDILTAETVSTPRPYSYGVWKLPFDGNGKHNIIGATYKSNKLFIALSKAGQVDVYDRPPLVLVYKVL